MQFAVVKIFPASTVGGTAFLRAMAAVFPTVRFVPTGGVTAETFLKKASIAKATPAALAELSAGVIALAEHEGFPAHAAAMRLRTTTTTKGPTPA